MKAGEIFVAGKWQAPVSGETYQPINPANEEPVGAVGKADERDIDTAVAAARKAFDEGPWPKMGAHERGRIVWRLGDLITQHLDEMAKLESLCTGKTMFDSGKVEIPFAAEVFRYFGGWASKIHGETLALRDNAFTFTLRQPVGVVGAIVPWNFPFLLSSWKIAPALAAGNTMVLKPASQTPLTALKFAELCQEAGLPEGVFNVVTGPGGKVGMAMVRDPRVDKIAFTGSTEVGKQIMREAAGTLKRLSLELGGKSPNIVFADADMEAAVRGAMTGIFYNKGEVCAAGSRLFLEQSVHDEFMSKLTDRVKTLKVGDPMDKATRMGPVVSKSQMDTVLSYIESGKQEGAQVVSGGGRAQVGNGKGFFVEPTIFDGVTNTMKIAREEIFGPVLSVLTFRTPDEAIEKANNTPYGLSAGIWTEKGSRILAVADRLRAGVVWANTFNKFDPASPFGGYKESGYGREGGRHGLEAYLVH